MKNILFYSKPIFKDPETLEASVAQVRSKAEIKKMKEMKSEADMLQVIDSGDQDKMLLLAQHGEFLTVRMAAYLAKKASKKETFDALLKRTHSWVPPKFIKSGSKEGIKNISEAGIIFLAMARNSHAPKNLLKAFIKAAESVKEARKVKRMELKVDAAKTALELAQMKLLRLQRPWSGSEEEDIKNAKKEIKKAELEWHRIVVDYRLGKKKAKMPIYKGSSLHPMPGDNISAYISYFSFYTRVAPLAKTNLSSRAQKSRPSTYTRAKRTVIKTINKGGKKVKKYWKKYNPF